MITRKTYPKCIDYQIHELRVLQPNQSSGQGVQFQGLHGSQVSFQFNILVKDDIKTVLYNAHHPFP